MIENQPDGERKNQKKIKALSSWSSLLSVLFRLVIIMGWLVLILFLVVFILTSILPIWTLVFPLSIIVLGIVLARVEYSLQKRVKRLKSLKDQGLSGE